MCTTNQLTGTYKMDLPDGCTLILNQPRNVGGRRLGYQPETGLAKVTGRYFAFQVQSWGNHWQRCAPPQHPLGAG